MEQIPGATPVEVLRPVARAALECLLAARGKPPLDSSSKRTAAAAARLNPTTASTATAASATSTTYEKTSWIAQVHATRVIQQSYRRHAEQGTQRSYPAQLVAANLVRAADRCVVGPLCAHLGAHAVEHWDDPRMALRLLRKGSKAGDASAQRRLGVMIYREQGKFVLSMQKLDDAIDFAGNGQQPSRTHHGHPHSPAAELAEGGDAEEEVGRTAERSRDLARARHLFSCSAAQGDPIALNNLAVMLAHGIGGPADHKLACRCLLEVSGQISRVLASYRFASSPPPFALFRNAALLLYHGSIEAICSGGANAVVVSETDLFQAKQLFSLASAHGGDAVSEFYLGQMCERGEGATDGLSDGEQARAWYVLAAMHDASTDLPPTGTYLHMHSSPDFAVRRNRGAPVGDQEIVCLALRFPSVAAGAKHVDFASATAAPVAAPAAGPVESSGAFRALGSEWTSDAKSVAEAVLEARARLGRMHYDGVGGARDAYKARIWLQRAAARGHGGAALSLASLLQMGEGGEYEPRRARELYALAASHGLVRAQTSLATMLREGEGGDIDRQAARWYFSLAADKGDQVAMLALGTLGIEEAEMMSQGLAPMAQTAAPAARHGRRVQDVASPAEEAKGSESSSALGSVASFTSSHASARAAASQAVRLFIAVAEQGDVVAQLNLAMLYESGDKGVARDLQKAKEWFAAAAAQGEPEAMTRLANILLSEDFATQQRSTALRGATVGRLGGGGGFSARRGASYYVPSSTRQEGQRHLSVGAEKMSAARRRAIHLYTRAAEIGHPDAQRSLGALMWERGRHEEARAWLEQAANAGHASEYWKQPPPYEAPPAADAAEMAAARAIGVDALRHHALLATVAGQKASARAATHRKREREVRKGDDAQKAAAAEASAVMARERKELADRRRDEAARTEAMLQRHRSPYAEAKAAQRALEEAQKGAAGRNAAGPAASPAATAKQSSKQRADGGAKNSEWDANAAQGTHQAAPSPASALSGAEAGGFGIDTQNHTPSSSLEATPVGMSSQ